MLDIYQSEVVNAIYCVWSAGFSGSDMLQKQLVAELIVGKCIIAINKPIVIILDNTPELVFVAAFVSTQLLI